MKKKKYIFYVLCLAFCIVSTGCAKVTPLSEEEEETIATYCAKTVSKFNVTKQQGYVNLVISDEEEEETSENLSPEPSQQESETEEATSNPAEDGTEETNTSTPAEDVPNSDEAVASQTLSMTDALAVSGLSFQFKNSVEMSYYSMGGFYDVNPQSGNDFLVITYEVTNTTDSDIVLDIPSTGIVFRASVGGASNTADKNPLLNDLSVFSGTIEAGNTEELILLFQFKPENLSDMSSLNLQMIQGDTTTNIEF